MMLWLIAVPSVLAVGWLVWWSSGRAKPDLRRRSIQTQIGIQQGRGGMYDAGGGSGPDGSGPGGGGGGGGGGF